MGKYFTTLHILVFVGLSLPVGHLLWSKSLPEAKIDSLLTAAEQNLNHAPLETVCLAEAALALTGERAGERKDKSLWWMARGYLDADQHSQSIRWALKLYDQTESSYWQGRACLILSSANYSSGHLQQAMRYNRQAETLALVLEDEELLAGTYNIRGLVFLEEEKEDSALWLLHEARTIYEAREDTDRVARMLNNIGVYYVHQEDWARAQGYFREVLLRILRTEQSSARASAMINLGDTYLHQGKSDSALLYLRHGLKLAEEIQKREWAHNASFMLSQAFEARRQYDSAYYYLSQANAQYQALFDEKVQGEIADLQVAFAVKEEAQALALARNRSYVLALTAILVCLLLGIGLVMLRQRLWRKMSLQAATLASQSSLIDDLHQRLADLQLPVSWDPSRLGGLMNARILTDADWEAFKRQVEQLLPGYLLYLREAFPDLTSAERRMYVLISLRLTPKECADMLGISLGAVAKSRYRLKKKLGLDQQDDLLLSVEKTRKQFQQQGEKSLPTMALKS